MTDTLLPQATTLPNGPAGAAILAAGAGSAALGMLALAADASPAIDHVLTLYHPTGALSGVTTVAIIVWLGLWSVLAQRWHRRQVNLVPVNIAAVALLAVGILLTFPPVMDLLQGK